MHHRVSTVALSIIAFAATTGLVIAAAPDRSASGTSVRAKPISQQAAAENTPWIGVDPTKNKPAMQLKPRSVKTKPITIERPTAANGSRLIVKFADELKLRTLPNGNLISLTGMDTTGIQDLVDAHAVLLEPATVLPEERLQAIINRAELHSGKAQPDIGGMYYVSGFSRDVDAASKELLRHDLVEWIQFQPMDPYTANLVSVAAAPAPRPQPGRPQDTGSMLAAPRSGGDEGSSLVPGGCCIYTINNGLRQWEQTCSDEEPADCAAIQNPPNSFTNWNVSLCGVVNCDNLLIGACCMPSGACLDLFQVDCTAFGGSFEGGLGYPTFACGNAAVVCLVPTGACCLGGGACQDETQPDCITLGGDYQGDGTNCASGICDPLPIQFGACCFSDDTALAPLSSITANAAGGFGCFMDDTAPCAGDGPAQEPYPTGPDNPLMVINCQIVGSTGQDPAADDFITAEENCSDLGGEFLGDGTTCELCPAYGACCSDGDCENTELENCDYINNGDVDIQTFVDPVTGAGQNFWPTGNAVGGPYYPQSLFNPTGRIWATSFEDGILINVGYPPDPTGLDVLAPTCPPVFDNNFMDITTNNYQNALLNWTGFIGFRDLNGLGPAPVTDPENHPIPVNGVQPGESVWRIACDPAVSYCDYSYCTNWCYGPFADSQGNQYDGCIVEGDPPAPVTCQNMVPTTRCRGGFPWFCGEGEAMQTLIPVQQDLGCTGWYTDPEEVGLFCRFPTFDAVDNPISADECGTADTALENQLNGSCFWDRSTYPTYLESYIPDDPFLRTPWGAMPMCYNGPFCDQWDCCEDVCAIDPTCCEWGDYPAEPAWDNNCAQIAQAIDAGTLPGRCQGFSQGWFPDFPNDLPTPWPASCGINLVANNQCMSPVEDLALPRAVQGGCADLQCCAMVCVEQGNQLGVPATLAPCAFLWDEDCVEIAKQVCYYAVPPNTWTPDFTPLQFHLKGNLVPQGRAQNGVPSEYRSLIYAPYYVRDTVYGEYQSILGVSLPPLGDGIQVAPIVSDSRWQGPGLQLQQGEDFTPSSGLYSWGDFLAQISRGMHPHGPHVNGARGLGVKVAVLDMAAWVQEYVDFEGVLQGARHEDLMNVKLEGRDTPHPPVKMIFDEVATRPQRGTAILGAIAAPDNGFGVTGVAPECEPYFFPVVDVDLGFREVTAWTNAIDSMSAGDIILATYVPFLQQPGCADSCLMNDEAAFALMNLATDAGIIVVVPAGDFGCDIDAVISGLENIDVIVVAGAMPNRYAQRWWTSNYTTTQTGDAFVESGITCSSWGVITTTGGNMNLTDTAFITMDDNPDGDPEGWDSKDKKRRSYTNDFGNNRTDGGSLAASALVTGSLACVQGLSLQRYGQGQPPGIVHQWPWDMGFPQTTDTDNTVNSSWDDNGEPYYEFDMFYDPGAGWSPQRLIQPELMGLSLVTDSDYALDEAGYITDIKLIKGDWQSGTISSLRQVDENYYVATSEPSSTGYYSPPFDIPGPVFYNAVGNYVDMMVEFTVPQTEVDGNQVDTFLWMETPPVSSIVVMYTWNWNLNKWQFMGVNVTFPGDEPPEDGWTYTTFMATANDLVNESGKMYQRVVTLSPGFSQDGGESAYTVLFDMIHIDFIPGFGGGGGPPG